MNQYEVNNKLVRLWKEYNNAKIRGMRKDANKLLAAFISWLKIQDKIIVDRFVYDICCINLNKDVRSNYTFSDILSEYLHIQHPLFKEIILPVLTKQYRNNNAEYIRWIGQFEQYFYSNHKMTVSFLEELEIKDYFDATFFFEKSFLIDRNQKTLDLLLTSIAERLNYSTHEVPWCVLLVPDAFDSVLEHFKLYWNLSDNQSIWKAKVKEWDIIAFHWRRYQSLQEEYAGFKDYLTNNNIELW